LTFVSLVGVERPILGQQLLAGQMDMAPSPCESVGGPEQALHSKCHSRAGREAYLFSLTIVRRTKSSCHWLPQSTGVPYPQW